MSKKRAMMLVALMIAVMMLFTAFASCKKQEEQGQTTTAATTVTTTTTTQTQGTTETTESTEEVFVPLLPIVETPTSIKIWLSLHNNHVAAGVSDLSTVVAVQELENRTNIKVEWTAVSPQNAAEQFTLMTSAGNLPDAFNWYNDGATTGRLASQEVVQPLEDLVNEYAPNILKELMSIPDLWRQSVDDGGHLWSVPGYTPDIEIDGGLFYRLIVRRDWLEKVGMSEPKTQDDWYQVLKAFKDNAGILTDEDVLYPYSGNPLNALSPLLWWPLGIPGAGVSTDFFHIDGEVYYSPMTDEYRQGMEFGRKLFAEGLIDPDLLTQQITQVDQKIARNQVGASVQRQHIRCIQFKDNLAETVPDYDMWVTPFLQHNDGNAYVFHPTFIGINRGTGLYITSTSDKAEIIIRWLDYQWTDEGAALMSFGLEEEHHELIQGRPIPIGPVLNPLEAPKYILRGILEWPSKRYPNAKIDGVWMDYVWERMLDERLFDDTVMIRGMSDISRIYPTQATLLEDESRRIANIMTDINALVSEKLGAFLTGAESLDNFDSFQALLRRMNIEEAIQIYQNAMDRYMQR